MAPTPRPLDPPRHGPHPDPLLLRDGLSPQVSGAIAGAQILPVGKGLAAAHHRQIDVLPIAEHLSRGATVSVDALRAESHHRTDRGQLLQSLPGRSAVGALGRLGGVDAGHADRLPLAAIHHPQGVAITHG